MVLRPERFTEQAQQVLANSQEILRRFNHSQWDVEHIMLALLEQEGGLTEQILEGLEVSIPALKAQVEEALDQVPKTTLQSSQVYATPRSSRLLDNAAGEADRLKDEFIGAEHLLIAATMEEHGPGVTILKNAGITQEKVYQALAQIRGTHRVTDPRAESKYRSL